MCFGLTVGVSALRVPFYMTLHSITPLLGERVAGQTAGAQCRAAIAAAAGAGGAPGISPAAAAAAE